MGQVVFQTFALPEAPLDAAAHFFSDHVPFLRDVVHGSEDVPFPDVELDALAIVFPAAGKDHHGWRLSAIQELAREMAPKRVNGLAGDDQDAIDRAIDWLATAPGVTGQLLAVDGKFTESR